jgi:hypothetical protein
MYASSQWADAQRWAERWADSDRAYERALSCGFAAQHDVQTGALTLAEAERWALPRAVRRVSQSPANAAVPRSAPRIGVAARPSQYGSAGG